MILYESEIEQISLELLRDENGYVILYGPDLLEGASPERGYSEVVLKNRLRAAINRINPRIPEEAREETYKKALRTQALTVIDNNEAFHHLLTEGVDVKFSVGDGKAAPTRSGWWTSRFRRIMSFWPSTSSQWWRIMSINVRILFFSSTACRWWSSN